MGSFKQSPCLNPNSTHAYLNSCPVVNLASYRWNVSWCRRSLIGSSSQLDANYRSRPLSSVPCTFQNQDPRCKGTTVLGKMKHGCRGMFSAAETDVAARITAELRQVKCWRYYLWVQSHPGKKRYPRAWIKNMDRHPRGFSPGAPFSSLYIIYLLPRL